MENYSYAPNQLPVTETGQSLISPGLPIVTISRSYDKAGRPANITNASTDTAAVSTVTAGYYLDGTLRTATDGDNSNTYAYDGAGRVSSRSDKPGATDQLTSYAYNDAGVPSGMTSAVNPGVTSSWTYDQGGRPQAQLSLGGTELH
jgi:YD repeat-containing protein